ncbi:MAG: SseB family protein [Lachnospiraceae bacterium]|nr:SseB family protein [Lachnospiraceae bacterium]
MNRHDFIRNIPKLKEIYVLHSRYTKQPFVFCHKETMDDYIVIYTQEEPAVARAKAMIAEKRPATVVKCSEKEIPQIFSSLKELGINAIEFIGREKGEDYLVQTKEFLRWPDFSDRPLEQRPVENPSLQLSLLYFLQEYRRETDAPDRGDVQALSEEVYVNLTRARFLLGAQPVEDGSAKNKNALMLMKDPEGKALLPLFTDIFEVRRFARNNPPKQFVSADLKRAAQIVEQSEAIGVVLNPGSSNYAIEAGKVKEILDAFAGDEEA